MPKHKPSVDDSFGSYNFEAPVTPKAGKVKKIKFQNMAEPAYEKVETEEADHHEPVGYPRTVKNDHPGEFMTNYVSTTKYSRFTFLPLAILQQYKRGANLYLLFIAVLCCIPLISPLMPIAAVMPVVFVLSISLIREGMEDYQRYQHDEELNNKTCKVRNTATGAFSDVMWKDVHVGDMIQVFDRDWIPTDIVLLTSSAPDGAAYIDTMDLDGETNLKRRSSPKLTAGTALEDCAPLLTDAVLKCVGPSGNLYSFDGTVTVGDRTAAVSEQNLLLRSSRLRNTKWAVGLVVYTGQESKVMLNSRSSSNKQSALEGKVNGAILAIFIIQLAMAVLSALLAGAWSAMNCPGHSYLSCSSNGAATGSLTFWTYIILLNSLIPASLIVTMEIVKVVHASFINWDHDLVKRYDAKEAKWRKAEAHTSTLNEGLGQIDYIFSDKTGTLTENKMELRYVSIDAEMYDAERGDHFNTVDRADGKIDFVGPSGPTYAERALEEWSSAWLFNRMLAVCQTVLIERENGEVSYNADSPDEVALVLGGKGFGCEFTGREGNDLCLLDVYPSGVAGSGEKVEEVWRILNVVPFSSKRKRMTVIVQRVTPPPDSEDTVHIWMKGADNMIMDRIITEGLSDDDQAMLDKYNKHLLHFSMEGLRTLCFATRPMAAGDYAAWSARWDDATLLPPVERDATFEALAVEVEDGGFRLCGCTAVEDKLQAAVPETIVRLARAKIKLWMLTGDKQETAIEIGRSTNLIVPSMKVHILNSTSEYDVNLKLDSCLAEAIFPAEPGGTAKQALVVDGATLGFVLDGDRDGHLICKPAADKFVMLATQCRSVIVCRSSPLQKALIVLLVRKYVPGCRSLSVGDGANDVPMIRAASIGVGIAGLEGMQAARASDYSVQQFRDLDRLLLHHGRLSYFRIANMCSYFFYKSWAFTLPQWLFGFYCGYSGQTFYEALYVPSYNMFFTSAPVFARAVLDTDVLLSKAGPLLPELYHVSKEDKLFNAKVLAVDLILSFVHALCCFFGPHAFYSRNDGDLWQVSIGCYSMVVYVCTMRLVVHTRAFSGMLVFAYAFSICTYITFLYTYDKVGTLTIRGAAPKVYEENYKFKLLVFFGLGVTATSEMVFRYLTDNLHPTNVDVVRPASAEDIAVEGDRRDKEASAAQKGGDDEPAED
jgi:phospholipid-translocating P-type ATPase (flippase)